MENEVPTCIRKLITPPFIYVRQIHRNKRDGTVFIMMISSYWIYKHCIASGDEELFGPIDYSDSIPFDQLDGV